MTLNDNNTIIINIHLSRKGLATYWKYIYDILYDIACRI